MNPPSRKIVQRAFSSVSIQRIFSPRKCTSFEMLKCPTWNVVLLFRCQSDAERTRHIFRAVGAPNFSAIHPNAGVKGITPPPPPHMPIKELSIWPAWNFFRVAFVQEAERVVGNTSMHNEAASFLCAQKRKRANEHVASFITRSGGDGGEGRRPVLPACLSAAVFFTNFYG